MQKMKIEYLLTCVEGMVSQPLSRRLRRFLFYLILIFVPIITASWLRTITTYVSVHECMFVRAISVTFFVPADICSRQVMGPVPLQLLNSHSFDPMSSS